MRWTKTAKYCYYIDGDCSKCNEVPKWFKPQCQMKKAVITLIRLFGKPFERLNSEVVIEDSEI